MMFFVYHLQTYSPKNRAWKKVIDYVEKYKNTYSGAYPFTFRQLIRV